MMRGRAGSRRDGRLASHGEGGSGRDRRHWEKSRRQKKTDGWWTVPGLLPVEVSVAFQKWDHSVTAESKHPNPFWSDTRRRSGSGWLGLCS